MVGIALLSLCLQAGSQLADGVIEFTESNRTLIAQWAAESAKAGDGNANVLALDKKFRAAFGYDPHNSGHVLLSNDRLFVSLTTGLHLYRTAFVEAMRMMEPVPAVPTEGGVAVIINPRQIDSPDMVKVVVQRDGTIIVPIRNSLQPSPFETRMGAKAMIGSGDVVFPASSFRPGARVTVTLIPRVGGNLVFEIPSTVLASLR